MNNGKTGLVILTVLAGLFFLFIAILFNTSTKRQAAIDRRSDLDTKLDSITEADITIYWIGEPQNELEHLMPVIKVIPPATASKDTLPIRGASFHVSEYNQDGQLIDERIPIEYSDYIMIVISGSPVLTDDGKDALLDAVSRNGVPVLAIGDDASELLGQVLSYRSVHKGQGSSLYYCLGKGYKENPISEDKVNAGGMDLAEAIPDLIVTAVSDYVPQI